MTNELVFTIQGKAPVLAQATTLADAGLKERQDVEEWVAAEPKILGPDVLVVTTEFRRLGE